MMAASIVRDDFRHSRVMFEWWQYGHPLGKRGYLFVKLLLQFHNVTSLLSRKGYNITASSSFDAAAKWFLARSDRPLLGRHSLAGRSVTSFPFRSHLAGRIEGS